MVAFSASAVPEASAVGVSPSNHRDVHANVRANVNDLRVLAEQREAIRTKIPVRVATTTNGTLASSFAAGQTVDGVVLAAGDRILIKDQSAPSQNGIYVVGSAAPTRATDADNTGELAGAIVSVLEGNTHRGSVFLQGHPAPIVNTTDLLWFRSASVVRITQAAYDALPADPYKAATSGLMFAVTS